MVNSKKLLSLFLAVVMVFSALTVMASAYTVGPEVAGDINYKYSVEKVDKVPETAAGSAEYTADNIYAVSLWMQSDYAVENVTAPFHFNKTLFSPIMLFDGEATYPHGAGFGVDDYYANMGEGAIYAYSEGDYLKNTGMYKADGKAATTKALAKCIGLGNSNSEGVSITAELVSPDHPLYSKWGAGLSADTGVMYVNLDVVCKTKTAYLNTIEGITQDTGWNKMFTVYFEAIAEDVNGAEFGVFTENCFTVDGVCDTNKGYFESATARKALNANKNVVSNAVVEAVAEKPVYHVKNQVQWADETAGTINLGVVAGFKASDIGIKFSDGTDGLIKGQSTNVTAVGADLAINGVPVDGATSGFVYETTKDGELAYNFRIVLKNVDPAKNATYTVTPYVIIDGTPEYGNAIEISGDKINSYVETKLS